MKEMQANELKIDFRVAKSCQVARIGFSACPAFSSAERARTLKRIRSPLLEEFDSPSDGGGPLGLWRIQRLFDCLDESSKRTSVKSLYAYMYGIYKRTVKYNFLI